MGDGHPCALVLGLWKKLGLGEDLGKVIWAQAGAQ